MDTTTYVNLSVRVRSIFSTIFEFDMCPQLLCLFCDSLYGSCSSLFEHCASAHSFDFHGIKKAYALGYYDCFKLINSIRSKVAVNECWICGTICMSKDGKSTCTRQLILT